MTSNVHADSNYDQRFQPFTCCQHTTFLNMRMRAIPTMG